MVKRPFFCAPPHPRFALGHRPHPSSGRSRAPGLSCALHTSTHTVPSPWACTSLPTPAGLLSCPPRSRRLCRVGWSLCCDGVCGPPPTSSNPADTCAADPIDPSLPSPPLSPSLSRLPGRAVPHITEPPPPHDSPPPVPREVSAARDFRLLPPFPPSLPLSTRTTRKNDDTQERRRATTTSLSTKFWERGPRLRVTHRNSAFSVGSPYSRHSVSSFLLSCFALLTYLSFALTQVLRAAPPPPHARTPH